MKRGVLLLGVLFSASSYGQDLFGNNKEAYVLMPAETISSGMVEAIDISMNGRYVIFQQRSIPKPEDILGYNPSLPAEWNIYDRTTKKVIHPKLPAGIVGLTVLGDSRHAFVFGREDTDPQGFYDLQTGTITATHLKTEDFTYSGDEAFAPFVVTQHRGDKTFIITRPDGASMTVELPAKTRVLQPMQAPNGTLRFHTMRQADPTEFGTLTVRIADGQTTYEKVTRDAYLQSLNSGGQDWKFMSERDSSLSFVKLMAEQTDKPKAKEKQDIPEKARLGLSDAHERFSPDNSYVVYLDAGALLLREIKPIDAAEAKKLFAAAMKKKALMDAKQTALAMMMYAADMDDVMPGQEGWDSKVMPYIKDSDVLKNFTYTFNGGNLANVSDPASTQLGYVMGPGGRAVAYVDGHVKWIPNP